MSPSVNMEIHTKAAFQVMEELRMANLLCDVTLRVDDAKFYAHKVVLAGCSPHLRAMFTNGMTESWKDEVQLYGLDPSTMQSLLDFMYRGSVELNVENAASLLHGASFLDLTSLRAMCSQFLQNQLRADNCLGIHQLADMYMCQDLESTARSFINQHFLDVIHTDEFMQLTHDQLCTLLQSDHLRVVSETQVFEALSAWVEWDANTRGTNACDILEYIKLTLLEMDYIENSVLQRDFIRNCAQCQLLISKAIIKKDNLNGCCIHPRAEPPSIFVVGGRNDMLCQLKSTERYDFVNDQWVSAAQMNVSRTAVGAANLDGCLYVVGGECALVDLQDQTIYVRVLECYDPVLRTWLPKPEMKVARSFVGVAAVERKLYVIGGEDRACSYDIMEIYDPDTEAWKFGPCMNRRRSGAGCTVCLGKIYLAGGYDKSLHMDRASMECYDPHTREWSFVTELEQARSGLALSSVDDLIYAFGGRNRPMEQFFNLVESYNTITQQWTTLNSMAIPRAWASIIHFDSRFFIIGGFNGFNRLGNIEVYDPGTDQWSHISDLGVRRAGCGAAVV